MKINDQITIGGQPAESDVRRLAGEGFKTLVNLRTDGERDQTMPPDEEGAFAREAKLEYLHIPVDSSRLDQSQVDDFRAGLAKLPAPYYIHCAGGGRASAFALMHLAVENGWSGDETLERARDLGVAIERPEVAQFVKGYVNGHRS